MTIEDKSLRFAIDMQKQIEKFEKENNLTVDVLYWGILAEVDREGNLSVEWADPNSRHVNIETKENDHERKTQKYILC